MHSLSSIPTPAIIVDAARLESNLQSMQSACDARGVELRPHLKTHKCVRIARRQLELGAAGLTCAKLSEAEAMLPAFDGQSNKRSLFIAHSLVDVQQAPRLAKLAASVDELIVACTSLSHAPALEKVLAAAGLKLPVAMALDSGSGREGARSMEEALALAHVIVASPCMSLMALYTHEGQLYQAPSVESASRVEAVHKVLCDAQQAIQNQLGVFLKLWPGCSASARRMIEMPGIDAVRPGAYVFGDIALCDTTQAMNADAAALTILATVVDRPAPGLALIDAGSKTFSGDKTALGWSGRALDGRDLVVAKVNEEHGYIKGVDSSRDVDALQVGERVRFVPAHVCPVVNLFNRLVVIQDEAVVDEWPIEARGCVT